MSDKPGKVKQYAINLEPRQRTMLTATLICATLFFALEAGERIGELIHQSFVEMQRYSSRWTLLGLFAAVGLAAELTRHVDPYISFLYGEGGGLENAFFSLIFVLFAVFWFVELKIRRVAGRSTFARGALLALIGAALCLRYGQYGMMVWLLVEIGAGAVVRSSQRRTLNTGMLQ